MARQDSSSNCYTVLMLLGFRVCALVLVASCTVITSKGASALESNREKALKGDHVFLDDQAAESARTIESEWIKQAILQNKPVLIVGAVIHGELDLKYVTVEQEVEFDKCKFDSWVNFSYATFKRNFIAGQVLFSHGVTFESASFAADVGLAGAIFTGPTVFQNVRVDGHFILTAARFAVKYEDQPDVPLSVSFHHSRFLNIASFGSTIFEGRAFFDGSHFGDRADFRRASFQQVSFDSSTFDKDCYFDSTRFGGPLSLREATFHTVFFSPLGVVPDDSDHPSQQFNGTVDLRGWTYTSFGGSWKSLFLNQNGQSRFAFYDRQPFTQLESSYLKIGKDESADAVYLTRRNIERKLKWNASFADWLVDVFFWLVNYGVESMRRLMIFSLFLLTGAPFFSVSPALSRARVPPVFGPRLPWLLNGFFPWTYLCVVTRLSEPFL